MAEVALPAPSAAAEAPPRPDFQIVPLRGLPIVAAVLVALIAAIAANKIWALEFFHVARGRRCGPGSTCSSGSCWARSSGA